MKNLKTLGGIHETRKSKNWNQRYSAPGWALGPPLRPPLRAGSRPPPLSGSGRGAGALSRGLRRFAAEAENRAERRPERRPEGPARSWNLWFQFIWFSSFVKPPKVSSFHVNIFVKPWKVSKQVNETRSHKKKRGLYLKPVYFYLSRIIWILKWIHNDSYLYHLQFK